MAEDALTQSDADTLLRMEKVAVSADTFHFPATTLQPAALERRACRQ